MELLIDWRTKAVRMKMWSVLIGLLVQSSMGNPATAGGPVQDARPQFRVFDATAYMGKPDMEQYGIEKLPVIYSGQLWDRNEDRKNLPREARVAMLARELASNAHNQIAAIDIEHWPWVEHRGDVGLGMQKFMTVLEWFKKYAPSVSFGYYTVPPVPDYDSASADPLTWKYKGWQKQNDQIRPFAHACQVLFPSLYSFAPNRKQWIASAIGHIQEARRYGTGVPVYVFLWPQYHEITRGLALQFVDKEFWRIQLETAKQHADGIVIWGGYDLKKNKPMIWDDTAEWWFETKSFLNMNQSALK